ncbi:MAG TPA: SRPBCC domain-containing protein [Nakamurella sp.]
MIDLLAQLARVHRSVAQDANPDEVVRVTLRRSYPTDPADLWEALTRPERLARWFSPVTGDLRPGGTFQIENNAGGDILACQPPTLLRTTFGDASSIVTVTLAARGADTELTLDHTVPMAIAGSVAGALFAGPGWDEALIGLWLHLCEPDADRVATLDTAEGREWAHRVVLAWVEVADAAGAPADQLEAGRQAALAQFAPHVPAGEPS